MAICPECHEDIAVGDWPFCPHGPAKRLAIHGDELDYWDTNLGKEPVHIRSKAQRRQLMAERGLREAVRHVPHPAGPDRNHTVDWSQCGDDYTMRYKRELIERAFQQPADEQDGPTIRPQTNEELREYARGIKDSTGR